MIKSSVIVKCLSASASYLRREAIKFGQHMPQAASIFTQNKVLDGYLMRAIATRDSSPGADRRRVLVRVIDTPALVALPGDLRNGASKLVAHVPVLSLVEGRDAFVVEHKDIVPDELKPGHWGSMWAPFISLGTFVAGGYTGSLVRPSCIRFNGVGIIETQVAVQAARQYTVNPYAFMGRNDRMLYELRSISPTGTLNRYTAADSGWAFDAEPVIPLSTPRSLVFSDSLLETAGALPFSKRNNPPPYDPSSTAATAYSGLQSPWARVVLLEQGVNEKQQKYHRLLVVAHVVYDMLSDQDAYGARGLWFGEFTVLPGEATLDSTHAVRLSSLDEFLSPWKAQDGQRYYANGVIPSMINRLSDGQVVCLSSVYNLQTSPPNQQDQSAHPFYGVLLNRIEKGFLSTTLLAGPVNQDESGHDFSYPVGADLDDKAENVFAVFFGSDYGRDDTGAIIDAPSIDVLRVGLEDSENVYSGTVPLRPCLYVDVASTECLINIGNGKYLFPVTSHPYEDPGYAPVFGDLAVAVFDSKDASVSLAGVIEAQPREAGIYASYIGRLDCPVKEKADAGGIVTRLATILLTFGYPAQIDDQPGGEKGRSYISYDSGATWQQIANYGSPAGITYCGTQIQARTREL